MVGSGHLHFTTGRLNLIVPPSLKHVHMTIKRRAAGFGLEWPGDGVAASLLEGGNRSILGVLGGGQQGPFWHRADDFDCSS